MSPERTGEHVEELRVDTDPEPDRRTWAADPTLLALDASAWRKLRTERGEIPRALCVEVGRRLLLAQLEFSEWMLRRVEKVFLAGDRSVSRSITVEFAVRADAPRFVTPDGRRLLLVPLSLMKRRTLVNLDLRDRADAPVAIPGIRLTQQLDESILLASVAANHPGLVEDPALRDWIHRAIAGRLHEVLAAYASLDGDDGCASAPFLETLRSDPLFLATANRFRTSFTLYVFLDEDDAAGIGRMIRMGFDEPMEWRYQVPSLAETPGGWRYRPGHPSRLGVRRGLAALGIVPIRLRLQVPGAEYAASYHFEMTAPPGVQIVGAALLAGRPNDPGRCDAVDRVVGHVSTVGLHALEVPNGSLCRVQVDVRPPARGWLGTMLVACLAICVVLGTVAYHWRTRDPGWNKDEITNIILLLVTTSAGVTTLVAQRDGGDVAARFVTGARLLGVGATVLPVAVAGTLAYGGLAPDRVHHAAQRWAVLLLCGASLIPLLLIALAWGGSVLADRRSTEEESPWDMTDHERARARHLDGAPPAADFHRYLRDVGFDTSAIGVRSAEAWHEFYCWDDDIQMQAVASLTAAAWGLPTGACSAAAERCAHPGACLRLKGVTPDGVPEMSRPGRT